MSSQMNTHNVSDNTSTGFNDSGRSAEEHAAEQARLAAAGLNENPLGAGVGTHSAGQGHTVTNVYQSNEEPVRNPGPVHIQHFDGPSGISTSDISPQPQHTHHHTERVQERVTPVTAPAAAPPQHSAPPPQQPSHGNREQLLPSNEDDVLDTSERARDLDADDHREHKGQENTPYTRNNREEAGGIRPHGTKPTQQTDKDTFENQAGSAHASTHKPTDPRDIDVSIGAKGSLGSEYAGTTSSSNMGPTSVGGGEGTGINRQTNDHTTGGMGKRDGEGAMGGGGGIVGKIAEKMGLGKGNTHTEDDGARATSHAAGTEDFMHKDKIHTK